MNSRKKIMKGRLNHIADIFTGVTLREKPVPATDGNAQVLLMQLGDLNTEGNIQSHTMLKVSQQDHFDKFMVSAGEIVFRGRGAGFVAAVMPHAELPIVVASPLIIIRPNLKKVDPHYLVWAMTNDHARRYYAEHSRGSNIVGIGKRDLDQLEIDLPPINVQKMIGQVEQLAAEEQRLLTRYQKAKSRLVEAMIVESINNKESAA